MPFKKEEQGESWGSDVPISEPVPSGKELKVTFDGLGFTMGGLTYDAAQEDLDDILRPIFQPEGYQDADSEEPPLVITGEGIWGEAENG